MPGIEIKFVDHDGWEWLVEHYEDDDNRWYIYHVDEASNQGFNFTFKSGGVRFSTGLVGEITDTNWHHFAMCKVADEYGIYGDVTQVGYVQDSRTDTFTGLLYIGQFGGGNGGEHTFYFDGHLDEVRIQHSNYFSAAPVSGLSDTITEPTVEYHISDTVIDTVSITPSATGIANYTQTVTDTVNITPLIYDAQTIKVDYEYYLGTDTGTTHIFSDTYKGDAGVIIPCQYVTKNTDFSDQDQLANDRWKTVYAVKLFYEDVYASTDIVVAISTDGGITWPVSKSQTLGTGDEKRKDFTYYFICTGQFFMFRVSSGSASTTFKLLGLEIEYQDAGEHFTIA